MLTEEAYRERTWGQFPTLRQALEARKIPDSYYGLTSVSGNIFDAFDRFLKMSIMVREYKIEITETAQEIGRQKMCHDLKRLEYELRNIISVLTEGIKEIQTTCDSLQRERDYRE